MMDGLFLGLDTSNYKTSAALADGSSHIVWSRSEYLDVPAGRKGLRQSEAFFMHSVRLPEFIREAADACSGRSITAIGVSSRPRRVEGSYMPCFIAGLNAAREIGAVLGIPVYEFSHQEGHAAAVIEELPARVNGVARSWLNGGDFLSCEETDDSRQDLLIHLSGGTTEVLLCRQDEAGYDLKIIGGTLDISAGQLIDRAGVAMGLPFPAGMYMDDFACRYTGEPSRIMPAVRLIDGWFNLSGAETKCLRTIEELKIAGKEDKFASLSHDILTGIGKLLRKCCQDAAGKYNIRSIYMAGGVASSLFIRSYIGDHIDNAEGMSIPVIFGSPELSGDNAQGTARLARRVYTSDKAAYYIDQNI